MLNTNVLAGSVETKRCIKWTKTDTCCIDEALMLFGYCVSCALPHLVLIVQFCSAHLINCSSLTAHNILHFYATATSYYHNSKSY